MEICFINNHVYAAEGLAQTVQQIVGANNNSMHLLDCFQFISVPSAEEVITLVSFVCCIC